MSRLRPRHRIRPLVFIVACVCCSGFLWPPAAPAPDPEPVRPLRSEEDSWRYTARGWERVEWWPRRPVHLAVHHIHPLNIAALQALLCIGVLVAVGRSAPAHSSSVSRKM